MTNPSPIFKEKPWWLFFLGSGTWVTLAPNVYVPGHLNPVNYPATVEHETVHLRRQVAAGLWPWLWRYVTSRRFRLQEEAVAIAKELTIRPAAATERCLGLWADDLSSWRYLWAARSPQEAKEAILTAMGQALFLQPA